MRSQEQERIDLECRQLLLGFYSAELNAHSRLIISFSVLLLTLLEVKAHIEIIPLKVGIYYFGIFLTSFALWFSLMRLLTYGLLVNAVTYAEPINGTNTHLRALLRGVIEHMLSQGRIFGVIPSHWFFSHGERNRRQRFIGVLICFVLATFTAFFVWKSME